MQKNVSDISIKQICQMIDLLSSSMDDYLYLYDFQNDFYYISSYAVKRFCLPANSFHNVLLNHKKFVYEEDFSKLQEDLSKLHSCEKSFHNMIYRWISIDGKPIWINCRGHVVYENHMPSYMIGCINEIGASQKADNLSGLLGEFSFHSFFDSSLPIQKNGYLLRLGLDDFKEVNEKLGLEYGDMILRKTAECISSCILPTEQLYRIVSDEFLIVNFIGDSLDDAIALYEQIRQALSRFLEENRYEAVFTISAGILDCKTISGCSYSTVMKLSEFSLNEAKRQGKNCCYTFCQEDYNRFLRKKEMSNLLRQSVNHDFSGFEVYYQPLFCLDTNRLYGAEALMRFRCDRYGMVSPAEFIPLLEETGLIIPAGRWILHQALIDCQKFQKYIPDFRISVNVSYIQVQKSDIINEIMSAVTKQGLSSSDVIIELTESGLLETDARFSTLWAKLEEKGILLALDDFGTGYSNFHYLYDLKPDIIKIDRTFTKQAFDNEYDYKLLALMSNMVHSLNLKICVEGIETEEELNRMRELKPDYTQGFYFGRPCPYSEFIEKFVKQE